MGRGGNTVIPNVEASEETTMFRMARQMFSAEELARMDEEYEAWKASPAAANAVAGAEARAGVEVFVQKGRRHAVALTRSPQKDGQKKARSSPRNSWLYAPVLPATALARGCHAPRRWIWTGTTPSCPKTRPEGNGGKVKRS